MRVWFSKSLRKWTAGIRVLPDFLIIGAGRCGTTTLYRCLSVHPDFVPASKQEVHYFDILFRMGGNWYRRHFPTHLSRAFRKLVRRPPMITGEATPYYMFHPVAPFRVSRLLPQIKLIALLRNPVDRAYAHYRQQAGRGIERLPFAEAIDREQERVQGERERIIQHDGRYHSIAYQEFSYLARGIYVDQLKIWMSLFPRDQFLILSSEDFFAAPGDTLSCVCAFLGLKPIQLREWKILLEGDSPAMEDAVKARLFNYFRPHNRRLYELVGRDFNWER